MPDNFLKGGIMEKEAAAKKESFRVSLFTVMDTNGVIRNSQGPPWNNAQEIAEELKRMTRGKITLMGRKTYESLPDDIVKNLSPKNAGMTFVITNKHGYKIKKEHASVAVIDSMATIPAIWWALEEKFKEGILKEIGAYRKVQADAKQKIPGLKKDPKLVMQLENEISRIERASLPILPEIVVIGGISLYKEMLDYATSIYAILVFDEFNGNESFPSFFSKNEWEIGKSVDSTKKMANGQCIYTSIIYQRKSAPKKYLPFFRPDLPPLKKPGKE